MIKKANLSNLYEEKKVETGKPLSIQELSSLIKASKASSFKAREIKKEMNNNFKKISLHEIAKKALIKKNLEIEKKIDKEQSEKDEKHSEKEDIKRETKHKIESKDEKTITPNDNTKSHEYPAGLDEKKNERIIEKKKTLEESSITEKEHQIELEKAHKKGFEEGRQKAFSEIKEGSDSAIANLKSITEELGKVNNFDLNQLEKIIVDKILELSTELSGKIIKALPAEFLKKIKNFMNIIENIDGNIEIIISENDLKILEKNKDIKKEISNFNISSSTILNTGELELKVNGIKILSKVKEN